jgi:hypothetical protein
VSCNTKQTPAAQAEALCDALTLQGATESRHKGSLFNVSEASTREDHKPVPAIPFF